MEQINYREEYKRLFAAYKANAAEPDASDRQAIKSLLDMFPYCQPLHVIHASSLKNNASLLESRLSGISILSPLRENLFRLIHHPEKITVRSTITVSQLEPEREPIAEFSSAGIRTAEPDDTGLIPDTEIEEIIESPFTLEEPETKKEKPITLEDSLMTDSDISSDFFTVDESAKDHLIGLHEETITQSEISEPYVAEIEKEQLPVKHQRARGQHKVTRYHDENLPFTFLWWLNKTRKEHTETYQPYVNFKLDTSRAIRKNTADNLNQQIMENIFHLQVPLDDTDATGTNTVEFKLKRKDEELIDKFIKQDPQIRPMQPDQISTENKARKSSEDQNDLVSETLARIYIEQMLFDKAIDTYKKLSLKFPEKNAYFADQISDLQKKIN